MAVLSIVMFVGITALARAYHVVPSEQETVVSQIARGVFGGRSLLYFLVQAGTMLILVLAANTAYADFPRLSSILARDRYLPRQFMNQGDRLAFSNGIIGLSLFAAVLLVIYGGNTHSLIPLYMIGVFVSFTISQAGMVAHWRRLRGPAWRTSAWINGFGSAVTGIVLVVVAVTKAHEGAWLVLLLIPVHVAFFVLTHRHYNHVATQLSLKGWTPSRGRHNRVVVPIGGVHRAVVQAVEYAKGLFRTCVRCMWPSMPWPRIRFERSGNTGAGCRSSCWISVSLVDGTAARVSRSTHADQPDDFVTVVLPEFVPARWWHHVFHNQRALLIKGALLFTRRSVVTSVPLSSVALIAGTLRDGASRRRGKEEVNV